MTWPINYQSPLFLDEWLEFNRYKWGVTPYRIRLSREEGALPAVEAILYLDKKGRILQPPLNPYLPVAFYPTPTEKQTRIYREWMNVSKLLAEEFKHRGLGSSVAFPPEVSDVRQWQWYGFVAEVKYTFYIELPHSIEIVDYSERKQINKATKDGFRCEIAKKDSYAEVIKCLVETEIRQGFRYNLTLKDLEVATNLLDSNIFRIYLCRASSGEVASTRIVISAPGVRAMDWVAGTKVKFLSSGATQLLIWHILEDLAKYGASGFDFCGANLPTVSAAKADWGGRLVPFFAIRSPSLRTLGSYAITSLKQWIKNKI